MIILSRLVMLDPELIPRSRAKVWKKMMCNFFIFFCERSCVCMMCEGLCNEWPCPYLRPSHCIRIVPAKQQPRQEKMVIFPWWRHQMETFSALLVLCAGNSPVTGEFPAQRPVTRSFDVFFYLRLNKRLSKQWWDWWFGTPSRPLSRHCNAWITDSMFVYTSDFEIPVHVITSSYHHCYLYYQHILTIDEWLSDRPAFKHGQILHFLNQLSYIWPYSNTGLYNPQHGYISMSVGYGYFFWWPLLFWSLAIGGSFD